MDDTNLSPGARSDVPEPTSQLPHRAIFGAALLVGATGNLLIRSPQGPGLNVLLFFVTLAVAIATASRMAGRPPSRESWSWILGGTLLSAGLMFRAAPHLQLVAFLAASAAFTFPALRAGAAWMRGSGVSDYLEAVLAAAGHAGFGALRVIAHALSAHDASSAELDLSGPQRMTAVVRGLLLAAPLLFIFGALFVSADRVFADLVNRLIGTTVDEWASHLLVTGILAWLAAGYLSGFLTGTRLRGVLEGEIRRPLIGIVEIGIALGLVGFLFAAFVAVQFRYLFAGAELVEVTPGLTYADYAREGFGQLAFASALVLPILLVSDWLLRRPRPRDHTIFRLLGSLQLLLLVLVIVSAFQRVRAYQDAYGLTEFRFYGVVFLAWLTLLSIWFGLTVLRGRRERFAFPALLSGFAVVVALFVANPDAWIARANLARSGISLAATAPESNVAGAREEVQEDVAKTGRDHPSIDVEYLASLSADAVPTLIRALPSLPPDAHCRLAWQLIERWSTEPGRDWRSWNRSVVRAVKAVRAEATALQRMIGEDAGCHQP